MKWMLEYLSPLKGRIALGLTVKMLGTVSELFIPFLLTHILENVIETLDISKVAFYGVIMAVCALLACVGNVVANRMASRVTMIFSTKMRENLFYKTLMLSARETDRFTVPSLESRITSDTYNVQNFVGMMQRMGVRAPILLLGGIAITLIMDPALALVMIATLPLIFIVVYSISRKGVPLYTDVQRSVDGMVRVVREDAQGIRVIKALSKNDYENRRYDKVNKELCAKETRAGTIMGVVNPVMTMLMNLGIAGVVAAAALLVARGTSSATTVIAFMQYFTLVSMAMMSLSRMFVMYTKCAASAKRITEVLDARDELAVVPDENPVQDGAHISFESVSFSYFGKKNNVENINFSLEKGSHLGIIGSTGSGKSTIVKLLLRFYDADSGTVRINGRDIRSYERQELTEMFGVALQNDFLYADTIMENIKFGRDITDEAVYRAAGIAQAHEFITAMEEGYERHLSSKGTNVSGGQKQRILIARAIASRPEILILDDSSSALDYKTDAQLRQALKESLTDSTVITVAQRVSSVKDCDLIMVIDEGRITGMGKHEQLLKDCPEYKQISDSQMGGALID